MRFIDEAKISLSAGKGGPGSISFRREKYIPKGGPDGGNGGAGGNCIFRTSNRVNTLYRFRFAKSFHANNGNSGMGSNKNGRNGADLIIEVPPGTSFVDLKTGKKIKDLTQDGQEWIALKGGRGGMGNTHFKSSTHQAPKLAQPGEEGESLDLKLELKLLADVGIIGLPNAGKSTLLSSISRAKPKIASYPFTTLSPVLGVVPFETLDTPGVGFPTLVFADIPGLIEGAHEGEGLGHRFLKHIERTRVLLHLLDGATVLENGPEKGIELLLKDYTTIRSELGSFNQSLLNKLEVVAINKVELIDPDTLEKARQALAEKIVEIRGQAPYGNLQPNEPYLISGATGRGIESLLKNIYNTTLDTQLPLISSYTQKTGPKTTKVALPHELIG